MVNGAIVQQKIQYGYAKCAQKIGAPFLLYRAPSPINPIQPNNLIGGILCSSNVSWEYMTNQKYGKSVWNLIIDSQTISPLHAQVGDYLIPMPGYYLGIGGYNDYQALAYNNAIVSGFTSPAYQGGIVEDTLTYFVAAEEFLQPILGVNCNRTISIIRPTQTIAPGYQGYAEYLPSTSLLIASGMPASILETSSSKSDVKLPTDDKEPRWTILIPNLGNLVVRVDDIITDDFNQDYVVTDNELTYLGWRILAEQVVNSR